MYIFAVALEDGRWHHVDSYTPRTRKPPGDHPSLRSIETREDEVWTSLYHADDPAKKAFGGRVKFSSRMDRESKINGPLPMPTRSARNHLDALTTSANFRFSPKELFHRRNLGDSRRRTEAPELKATDLRQLNIELPEERLQKAAREFFSLSTSTGNISAGSKRSPHPCRNCLATSRGASRASK